jgi:hypothetical protein
MREIGECLVKNPAIIQWAQRSLIAAGAATRCHDGSVVRAEGNASAVRRTVIIARLASFDGLSPDAAELAILETYLQLAPQRANCVPQPQASPATFRPDEHLRLARRSSR